MADRQRVLSHVVGGLQRGDMSGWIKLHRKITGWEWYQDTNTFRLFFHLLISANFEEKKWMGQTVKRGELISSRENIGKALGLTPKQIRLSEQKLALTESLAINSTNKFTKYTIVKYEDYQLTDEEEGKQKTNEGQTEGKQRATTKEDKNLRKESIDMFALTSEPETPLENLKSKKGTRLPADWVLPQEWGDWAEKQALSGQEIVFQAEKFKDYWTAKAGKDAIKAEWSATWRNWIRSYLERKSDGIQTKKFR